MSLCSRTWELVVPQRNQPPKWNCKHSQIDDIGIKATEAGINKPECKNPKQGWQTAEATDFSTVFTWAPGPLAANHQNDQQRSPQFYTFGKAIWAQQAAKGVGTKSEDVSTTKFALCDLVIPSSRPLAEQTRPIQPSGVGSIRKLRGSPAWDVASDINLLFLWFTQPMHPHAEHLTRYFCPKDSLAFLSGTGQEDISMLGIPQPLFFKYTGVRICPRKPWDFSATRWWSLDCSKGANRPRSEISKDWSTVFFTKYVFQQTIFCLFLLESHEWPGPPCLMNCMGHSIQRWLVQPMWLS